MGIPYRILSLDGGGIRGLMTAIWLEELESRLGKPLYKHFDLIAGTSTGAILACGISKGLDVKKIIELYEKKGRQVFPSTTSRLWSRASRLFSDGVSAPKYDGLGLKSALYDIFRTTQFGSLKIKPTLVTAYDVLGREAIVFKNTKPAHKKIKVEDICRATAAAPTYFPAHKLSIDGADVPLIDGGVVANNPTACAIAEAVKVNSDINHHDPCEMKDFIVASFGTGESIRRIEVTQAREWGATEWAIPLIDVLFDGSADSVDYIVRQLIQPERYFRFQTRLSDAYDDMDNADVTNINALKRIAKQYIGNSEGEKSMDKLCKILTST